MDRAYIYTDSFRFGKPIRAMNASKGHDFKCIVCGENVFLREGYERKTHFSHHKSIGDKWCEERIFADKTYKSYSQVTIDQFWNWKNQHLNSELEFDTNLPEIIFHNDENWKFLANILINEIGNGSRYLRYEFEKQVFKELKHNARQLISFLVDSGDISEPDVINFFWEIYVNLRLIYRQSLRSNEMLSIEKYKRIISYIKNNLKKSSEIKRATYPISITYQADSNKIECFQNTRNRRNQLSLNGIPNKFECMYQTPEVSALKKPNGVLITEFDEFENTYISTRKQLPIGTRVLLVGAIKELESNFDLYSKYSFEEIEIKKNIDGLNEKWGIIELTISMPNKSFLGECPDWIAWRYLEFFGGLKLKKSDSSNSFLASCPPKIQLNANINPDKIIVLSDNGDKVPFVIIDNVVVLEYSCCGSFVVSIDSTPYYLAFNLTSNNGVVKKEINCQMGWLFEENWPMMSYLKDGDTFAQGCQYSGSWLKRVPKMNVNKEWFDSNFDSAVKAEHCINELIRVRGENVIW